jgi:hypothetical protein
MTDPRPLPPGHGLLEIQRAPVSGTLASDEPESAAVIVPAEDPLPLVLVACVFVGLLSAVCLVAWMRVERWMGWEEAR